MIPVYNADDRPPIHTYQGYLWINTLSAGFKFWHQSSERFMPFWRLYIVEAGSSHPLSKPYVRPLVILDWPQREFFMNADFSQRELLPPEVLTLQQAMDYVAALTILNPSTSPDQGASP